VIVFLLLDANLLCFRILRRLEDYPELIRGTAQIIDDALRERNPASPPLNQRDKDNLRILLLTMHGIQQAVNHFIDKAEEWLEYYRNEVRFPQPVFVRIVGVGATLEYVSQFYEAVSEAMNLEGAGFEVESMELEDVQSVFAQYLRAIRSLDIVVHCFSMSPQRPRDDLVIPFMGHQLERIEY